MLRLALLIGCLALGVATTVVIASVAALCSGQGQQDSYRTTQLPDALARAVVRATGGTPGEFSVRGTPALSIWQWTALTLQSQSVDGVRAGGSPFKVRVYETLSGVPFRSLSVVDQRYLSLQSLPEREVRWGIPIGGPDDSWYCYLTSSSRIVPLRPVWPGFVANTLIYSATWFLLLLVSRVHRRTIRRWQGYCPNCKYNLRGDLKAGCPECGWNRKDTCAEES